MELVELVNLKTYSNSIEGVKNDASGSARPQNLTSTSCDLDFDLWPDRLTPKSYRFIPSAVDPKIMPPPNLTGGGIKIPTDIPGFVQKSLL